MRQAQAFTLFAQGLGAGKVSRLLRVPRGTANNWRSRWGKLNGIEPPKARPERETAGQLFAQGTSIRKTAITLSVPEGTIRTWRTQWGRLREAAVPRKR